jgi:hypothetical protein
MVTKSRAATVKRVFQLHFEVDEVEPPVWRRLWIPDTLTMAKLDRIIQTAMGWTNSHLHGSWLMRSAMAFLTTKRSTIRRRSKTCATRCAVLGKVISGFSYTYDFGDNWRHTVTIENRLLPDDSFNTWPMCIGGQNACSPEDVGGVCGYADFLEAIADPSHDAHAEMWQWSGGPFDATDFDVNATNAALRRVVNIDPSRPRGTVSLTCAAANMSGNAASAHRVSVWAWHLELKRPAPDHRAHDERDGDD